MNYDIHPSIVDFGTSNIPVTNPLISQTIPQSQVLDTQQTTSQAMAISTITSNIQNKNKSFNDKILSIFNDKTGNILSTAIGMAIGFSFKDFITSVVSNILQPVIIIILSYSPVLNNYLNLSSYTSKQNKGLNIHIFISNLVSFILTIVAVYYINMYISNQV
jgi:large-conductance mechanosensitive channel